MAIDPCKDESLLSALVDGELSPAHSAAVRRHIAACPLCRRRFDALQDGDALIRGMPALEPSAAFDRTFWRKIAELEEHRASRAGLRYLLTGWRPLLAAGLAAGVVAVIFMHGARSKRLSPEELFIARNMELLENYDVIDQMDILEQWDVVENMKEPS
jgi:anti-sigma factor RsiW